MQRTLLMFGFGIIMFMRLCLAVAETRISGYGSFIAAKTLDGEQYLSDYPKTGIYDGDWSFSPDTSIGVQLSQELNQNASFTIQLNSHGARNYEPEINWAYVKFQINTELSFQVGRKRLPLYYYSDFFDVGYAYNWIRPPVDNYTWQITNYNGVNLLYETLLGDWETSVNIYTGREDSHENDLLSYLSGNIVDETWKNIIGIVAEFSYAWINIRVTAMSSQLDRKIDDMVVAEDVDQRFTGLSININQGNFSLLSEFNGYKRDDDHIDVQTKMLSLAYSKNEITPYVTYSEFSQELTAAGGDEKHNTRSAGIRWDVYPDIAFKIQFDKFTDEGVNSQILGDSDSLSLGIDIVF